jgi:antitoxin HicB
MTVQKNGSQMFRYAIRLEQDDNDTVLVTCRDLPEVVTFGDTEDDAIYHALDAIVAALSFRMDENKDIPEASPPDEGEELVCLPSLIVQKIALYRMLRERKMTQVALASLMGDDPKTVRRLLDPTHASRQNLIDRAFRSLGFVVEPHIVEAPRRQPNPRGFLRQSVIERELDLV